MDNVKPKAKCLSCGAVEVTIVKLTLDGEGKVRPTQTTTTVCINRACSFYINIGKVKTWEAVRA